MASFNFFRQFKEDLAKGVHNFTSDATSTVTIAFCNATNAPDAAADGVLADLTTVSTTYSSSRVLSNVSATETGGTVSLNADDIVITATGGSLGPLRYIVLYNDDPTSPADPLIGWFDYGSEITLSDTQQLTIDFTTGKFATIS